MSEMDESDDFATKSDAFLSWLQQNNTTISPKIELADLRTQQAGRGVRAQEDIAEDEVLFTIPRSSILTTETSTLPNDIKSKFNDQWLSLVTAMIYEYQRGEGSIWKPYFDVLPLEFNTLMFWRKYELEHLEGTAVINKIGKESADASFKDKVIPVLQEHAGIFNLDDVDEKELLELCHRMGSTIMAYAFDLEKASSSSDSKTDEGEDWEVDEDENDTEILPKGMVPLADMLNADADRNNAKLYYEEDKVVMKSIKSIKAGEEIFNDYGPLPQADVLRRYGYTTPNYAKCDVVEIPLDLIKECTRRQLKMREQDLIDRTSYLTEQGVLEEAYDIARPCNPEEECQQFPEELCTLLNTLTTSKPDFEKLKQKDKLPSPSLTHSEPTLRLLYRVLVQRRADYKFDTPTDHERLTQHIANHPNLLGTVIDPTGPPFDALTTNHRFREAYAVVLGEKRVLQEAADSVQDLLRTLPEQGEGQSKGKGKGNSKSKKRKLEEADFEEEAKDIRVRRGGALTEIVAQKSRLGTGGGQSGRRTDLERKGKKTRFSGT